ncbi:hypothetical protein BYT27DRAFT_7186534 [Phlegmacium glaucopus]|nr:hypothetical protein BYT27DRAFT_7186534 [Phlegmacium glaucopus]
MSFVLNTTPNTSAKRKHLTDERWAFAPDSSKKQRHAASTINLRPRITLHRISNVVSSAISSKEAKKLKPRDTNSF